jgi:hypothetical protein
MQRLAYLINLSPEISQAANELLAREGLCTCGRVLRSLDPKFILSSYAPSKSKCVIAAYCTPCSVTINKALKRCQSAQYDAHIEATTPSRILKQV